LARCGPAGRKRSMKPRVRAAWGCPHFGGHRSSRGGFPKRSKPESQRGFKSTRYEKGWRTERPYNVLPYDLARHTATTRQRAVCFATTARTAIARPRSRAGEIGSSKWVGAGVGARAPQDLGVARRCQSACTRSPLMAMAAAAPLAAATTTWSFGAAMSPAA
jgi:hypothetical protein